MSTEVVLIIVVLAGVVAQIAVCLILRFGLSDVLDRVEENAKLRGIDIGMKQGEQAKMARREALATTAHDSFQSGAEAERGRAGNTGPAPLE